MASLTLQSTAKLPSGHTIPLLGLGVYRNNDAYPAVIAALKHGYRHIDTAEMYRNEAAVGKAVRDSGINREEIFVTTKIMGGTAAPTASIKASLERLDLGYVDLYLIHSPHGGKETRLKIWRALLEAKAQGKARDVGVSNFVRHLEEIREAGLETPAINQIELHPFCKQEPIVEYCNKHSILISAFCPLVRADFSDPVLQEISKKINKSPAQVLVRWSLQKGWIPLPKSSHPERIASNADVYDFQLSAEDFGALDNRPQKPISWNPIDEP
ncbi:Aldo/keto reductase [Irpex rosettiformis]|uniref:Aldo/keto reductase n=1 Tax=Irpex rosettiformis TaxID=378272 RepID=A0ACB8U3T5_9APHY|nr:Aldo/keto reductase [Irpex rosettiformis]